MVRCRVPLPDEQQLLDDVAHAEGGAKSLKSLHALYGLKSTERLALRRLVARLLRQGRLVGKDDFGNTYYEQRKGVGPLGRPRRWVTYTDFAEASKVPADWHGWLHYTVDAPPTAQSYQPRPWQRPHLMNMTGTPEAYRPPGSILGRGVRSKTTGDYKPWRPQW